MTETIPETIPIDELYLIEGTENEQEENAKCPVCQGIIASCFIDGVPAETCLSCEAVFYCEDKIQWQE